MKASIITSTSTTTANSSSTSTSTSIKKKLCNSEEYPDISVSSILRKSTTTNATSTSNVSPIMKIKSTKILPPLPLQEFKLDTKNLTPITISGETIKNINHNINYTDKDDDFYDESECTVEGNLHDPFISKKLSKFYTYSDRMETKIFADLKKYVCYICRSFSVDTMVLTSNSVDDNDKVKLVDKVSLSKLPCLTFDSDFESGNIDIVQLVEGRDSKLVERSLERISKDRDFQLPVEVDQEYDLTIRTDINTKGNIQWYYFSINSGDYGNTEIASCAKKWTYPCKVRFNIINFGKSDSLYNYGMKPAVFSKKSLNCVGNLGIMMTQVIFVIIKINLIQLRARRNSLLLHLHTL